MQVLELQEGLQDFWKLVDAKLEEPLSKLSLESCIDAALVQKF